MAVDTKEGAYQGVTVRCRKNREGMRLIASGDKFIAARAELTDLGRRLPTVAAVDKDVRLRASLARFSAESSQSSTWRYPPENTFSPSQQTDHRPPFDLMFKNINSPRFLRIVGPSWDAPAARTV